MKYLEAVACLPLQCPPLVQPHCSDISQCPPLVQPHSSDISQCPPLLQPYSSYISQCPPLLQPYRSYIFQCPPLVQLHSSDISQCPPLLQPYRSYIFQCPPLVQPHSSDISQCPIPPVWQPHSTKSNRPRTDHTKEFREEFQHSLAANESAKKVWNDFQSKVKGNCKYDRCIRVKQELCKLYGNEFEYLCSEARFRRLGTRSYCTCQFPSVSSRHNCL
jgi:hypothetical protein